MKIAVFKIFSLRMVKFPHYPFKPPSMKPTLTWRGVYLTKMFYPVIQQGELAFERHLSAFHQGRLIYYVNICHLFDGAIYHIVFFPLRMGRDFVFGRFRNWLARSVSAYALNTRCFIRTLKYVQDIVADGKSFYRVEGYKLTHSFKQNKTMLKKHDCAGI